MILDMSLVETHFEQHILTVRINRPEKKNALTLPMYEALSDALERAETDRSVRAVLLLGNGGSFCAGNDIGDFPDDPARHGPTPVMRFIELVVRSTVPIVAGIEGVAAGIGATMLLHLDSVVAASNARIVFPFLAMALVPEGGSSLLLTRQLGYMRAADLMLRAASLDGLEAHRLGLVSKVVDPGNAEVAALAIAHEFAAKPPNAMRRAKKLLKGDTDAVMQRIREEERELFACLGSAEGAEALAAFREKRKPVF